MEHHPLHEHRRHSGVWGVIAALFHWPGHTHEHGSLAADPALAGNEEGIRTIWWALLACGDSEQAAAARKQALAARR